MGLPGKTQWCGSPPYECLSGRERAVSSWVFPEGWLGLCSSFSAPFGGTTHDTHCMLCLYKYEYTGWTFLTSSYVHSALSHHKKIHFIWSSSIFWLWNLQCWWWFDNISEKFWKSLSIIRTFGDRKTEEQWGILEVWCIHEDTVWQYIYLPNRYYLSLHKFYFSSNFLRIKWNDALIYQMKKQCCEIFNIYTKGKIMKIFPLK